MTKDFFTPFRAVVEAHGIPASRKLVMVVLLHYMNVERGRRAWPEQKRLADEAGLDLRTVQRTLDDWEKVGCIKRERHRTKKGKIARNNTYVIQTSSLIAFCAQSEARIVAALDARHQVMDGTKSLDGTKSSDPHMAQTTPSRAISRRANKSTTAALARQRRAPPEAEGDDSASKPAPANGSDSGGPPARADEGYMAEIRAKQTARESAPKRQPLKSCSQHPKPDPRCPVCRGSVDPEEAYQRWQREQKKANADGDAALIDRRRAEHIAAQKEVLGL